MIPEKNQKNRNSQPRPAQSMRLRVTRFRQALARSAEDGLGNLARGTGQLCGETFGVQCVVTEQQVAHVQSSDQRRRRLW